MSKKKPKIRWIICFQGEGEIQYFDGSSLDSNINKAYTFKNFYIANAVVGWWNQRENQQDPNKTEPIEKGDTPYYIEEVRVKKSVKKSIVVA